MLRRRASLLIPLAVLLAAAPAAGQRSEPLPYGARLDSHVDFREDAPPLLNLKLDLPVTELVFEREGDRFVARMRTAVKLEDRDSGERRDEVFLEEIVRPDFASSRDPDGRVRAEYRMEVPAGRLRVEVLIYGRGNYLPWRERFPLDLPRTGQRGFFLQGPHFEKPEVRPVTPPFGFHDPWNVPPRHSLFLDGFAGRLAMGAELRVWEAGDSLECILQVVARDGHAVHYARRLLPGDAGSRLLRWEIPVRDLSMGPHRVLLAVGRAEEEQEIQGRLDLGLGPAAFGRDWDLTLDLLAYRAGADELELMEEAPPVRRRAVFEEFWDRRDTASGPENPAMEAFFRDLDAVGRQFGTPWNPGYRSDRGRIYLEHGPPQQVEEYSEGAGYRAREVWTYASGMVFVFEDRHGQGDYELVERWMQ